MAGADNPMSLKTIVLLGEAVYLLPGWIGPLAKYSGVDNMN